MKGRVGLAVIAFMMSACSITPDTITHQKPGTPYQYRPQPAPLNGAIFQQNTYRPMFEDHKARMVGDNLTIVITENYTATKTGSESSDRTSAVNYGTAPRVFDRSYSRMTGTGGGSREYEENDSKTANNLFTGTIAVTVIDVVPNGNLIVSGEKQIAMDSGSEFIRFSGVVDPKDITVGNQVASNRVADARIEYRTNTTMDVAEITSRMSRFFMSVFPF